MVIWLPHNLHSGSIVSIAGPRQLSTASCGRVLLFFASLPLSLAFSLALFPLPLSFNFIISSFPIFPAVDIYHANIQVRSLRESCWTLAHVDFADDLRRRSLPLRRHQRRPHLQWRRVLQRRKRQFWDRVHPLRHETLVLPVVPGLFINTCLTEWFLTSIML